MVGVADVLIAAAVTIAPFYLGLLTFNISYVRTHVEIAIGFALGCSFYFFLDPIRDTNGLGGFSPSPGLEQAVLLAAFSGAFLLLAWGKGTKEYWPLWILALGISIHSFPEASALAVAVPSYLAEFSTGVPSTAAFLTHKFLEGCILAFYCAASGIKSFRTLATGGVPLVLVGIAGASSSMLPSLDLTPIISAAAGGWLLVVLALTLVFKGNVNKFALVSIIVGFATVYSAGLLHSA